MVTAGRRTLSRLAKRRLPGQVGRAWSTYFVGCQFSNVLRRRLGSPHIGEGASRTFRVELTEIHGNPPPRPIRESRLLGV